MMYFTVLATEFQKLKRTRLPWVLALTYGVAPLMLGLMMAVLKDPDLGRRMGLLTTKAELTVGQADWPTYLMITGALFVGAIIVIGIAQAFVFGREYAEGTAKNMLTLPIARGAFVAAKLTVTAIWFVVVGALIYAEAIAVGAAIGLPGYSRELLRSGMGNAARTAAAALLLSSVPAWLSVATRGYIAPLGISVLLMLVGDLFAHTGWAEWVPWAIPYVTAGLTGGDGSPAGWVAWIVLAATFAAGSVATWLTLDRADNTQ